MTDTDSEIKMELIGKVVRHTKGGIVYCDAEPESGTFSREHNCMKSMKAGDQVIISYSRKPIDEEWFARHRFCPKYELARNPPGEWWDEGKEQVLVEGQLQHYEGFVQTDHYDDAVTLVDINILSHSPISE